MNALRTTSTTNRTTRAPIVLAAVTLLALSASTAQAQGFWDPPGQDPCDNPFILCGGMLDTDSADAVGESIGDYAETDAIWGGIFWLSLYLAPKVVPPEDWPWPDNDNGGGGGGGGGEGGGGEGGGGEGGGGEGGGGEGGGGEGGGGEGGGGEGGGAGGEGGEEGSSTALASSAEGDSPWLGATVVDPEYVMDMRRFWDVRDSEEQGPLKVEVLQKYETDPSDPGEYTVDLFVSLDLSRDGAAYRVRFPLKIVGRGDRVDLISHDDWDATEISPLVPRGDANGDDSVGLPDALTVLRHLLGGEGAPLACEAAADLDDNGKIDLNDTMQLFSLLFPSGGRAEAIFSKVTLRSCD